MALANYGPIHASRVLLHALLTEVPSWKNNLDPSQYGTLA